MEFLYLLANHIWAVFTIYLPAFFCLITVLVFVHEFGHYWVARRNGVKVDVFSIGFGPELFGIDDSHGTRWKFSLIPLGGYVKMYGDADPASTPDPEIEHMTEEQKSVSLFHKSLGQRAAVVVAGPAANFIFAMIVLPIFFMFYENPMPPAVISELTADAAAEEAGFAVGDRVIHVDYQTQITDKNGETQLVDKSTNINRLVDLQGAVSASKGRQQTYTLLRDGKKMTIDATPRLTVMRDEAGNPYLDESGNTIERFVIGIKVSNRTNSFMESVQHGISEVWQLNIWSLNIFKQVITGERSFKELGGPVGIAKASGETMQYSYSIFIWFMAIVSINLGLINLMPLPILDGGHLLFYAIEGIRGKALSLKAQEYGFRFGLAVLLTTLLAVTWNDIMRSDFINSVIQMLS